MARVAHAMAMDNPSILADVIEVQEFPDLAGQYQVMGVPKTVINEKVQFVGAVPEETFLRKLLEAVGETTAAGPDEEEGSSDEKAPPITSL